MLRVAAEDNVHSGRRSRRSKATFLALFFIIVFSAFSPGLLVRVNASSSSGQTGSAYASIAYGAIGLIRDDYIRGQFSNRMGSIAAYSVAPDSWNDPLDHICLANGTGYAVETVSAYYHRMVASLAAGQWDNATEWFGYLVNYYVDLWNPFNTANPKDPEKGAYDLWLGASISYVLDQLDMSSVDVSKVSNLTQFCESAATESRQLYQSLTTAMAGNDTAGALLVAKTTVQGAVAGLGRILETSFDAANLNSIDKELMYNSWIFIVGVVAAISLIVIMEIRRRVRELPRQRGPEEEAF
jgi:hypothetical protein